MINKLLKTKDGENITIRSFTYLDLRKLQKMNQYISSETRQSYRAAIPVSRPSIIHFIQFFKWTVLEIKLAVSGIEFIRNILMIFPRLVYIPFVAVNSKGEIVAFRYYNILGRRAKYQYIAEDGTVLRDDYQNKGIGTKFVFSTLKMVSKDVYITIGHVFSWNHRIITIIEKWGYQRIGGYRNKSGEEIYVYTWGRKTELSK